MYVKSTRTSARSRKNGARSATIKSRAPGALKLASEARDENMPAKRADFFKIDTRIFYSGRCPPLKRKASFGP